MKPLRILVIAAAVASGIVGVALATGVRVVAYAALAAIVLAGLWPLVLLLGGLTALVVLALLFAFLTDGDGGLGDRGVGEAGVGTVKGTAKLGAWYFGLLARIRRPAFWGFCVGCVGGCAVVWMILALYVVPRERQTLQSLVDLQEWLESRYASDGSYPPATPDERASTAFPDGTASTPPTRDAFGRPIFYRLSGAWKAATYSLSSLGADGRPSGDDLCVTGGTRIGNWFQRASGSARARWVSAHAGRKIGLRDTVSAIEASRCSPSR